ncbi:MAG TPA: sensor histidine kinase, partial [Candidatus Baltobacteraceae bacterium]
EDSAHARIVITLWPAMLQAEGDDADLLGALCALVDNALKYAPSGPVELTISAEGRCCTIAIADRGPGMDEEDLRGAFDRFYRGGSADGIEGTGLGLPIVRKEIERAGGTVTLANRAGGGLVCTIVLPLLQSLETSVPAPSVASAGAVSLDNR